MTPRPGTEAGRAFLVPYMSNDRVEYSYVEVPTEDIIELIEAIENEVIERAVAAIKQGMNEYWNRTGDMDPWLNGTMKRELEGIPPNTEERRKIIAKYQFAHDNFVGQRTAHHGYLTEIIKKINEIR